jgi:hypothetical protein
MVQNISNYMLIESNPCFQEIMTDHKKVYKTNLVKYGDD